jgi:hypothetical protein
MVADLAGAGHHRVYYVLLQQEYKTEEVVSVVPCFMHSYFFWSYRILLWIFLFFGKKKCHKNTMKIL